MLGKVFPFVPIGLFDVLLALVVGAYVFDVPIRGSLADLALGTFLYLMTPTIPGLRVRRGSSPNAHARFQEHRS